MAQLESESVLDRLLEEVFDKEVFAQGENQLGSDFLMYDGPFEPFSIEVKITSI